MADSENSSPSPPEARKIVSSEQSHSSPALTRHYSPKVSPKISPSSSPKDSPRASPKASRAVMESKSKERRKSPPPQPPVQTAANGNVELAGERGEEQQGGKAAALARAASVPQPKSEVAAVASYSSERRPSQELILEYNSRQATTPPMTLADLKKQRSQALQQRLEASMRSKEPEQVKDQIEAFNHQYPNSSQLDSSTNGNYEPPRRVRNGAPPNEFDDVKKYRFSDKNQVLSGKEDTSCCSLQ